MSDFIFIDGVGEIDTRFDKRREQAARILKLQIQHAIEQSSRKTEAKQVFRVWSDGTISIDFDGHRHDSWGAITKHIEWHGSLRASPVEVGDSILDEVLPNREETGWLACYTWWEGDFMACAIIRMLLACYVADTMTIARDELLTANQKGK